MRFQALGDTIITLPYLQSLKTNYPGIILHLLTRYEVAQIPLALSIFEKVITIGGGRNAKFQFLISILLLPKLWFNQYDAVLDLQNNRISKILRVLLRPPYWSQFDKYSPISAGERTRLTIEALGLSGIKIDTSFKVVCRIDIDSKLKKNGWDGTSELVLLNPAGNFNSRNWPIENYIKFAKYWGGDSHNQIQFVIMLLEKHQWKASLIKQELQDKCIDLSGKTSVLEAFLITGSARHVLTEDSGLMHMAWVQRIPTLAIFGSSRKDWSAPLGEWSVCLDASDLSCGPCMKEHCIFGDNHCLTRYSAEFVFNESQKLLLKK